MNKGEAVALAEVLTTDIPARAESNRNGDWTDAVFGALQTSIRDKAGWTIFPTTISKRGEYLCDFVLFEEGYGCRLACESQWQTHRSTPAELLWAFDKLKGVKADVKLYVFEDNDAWIDTLTPEVSRYAQLDPAETFIFMRWNHDHFERFVWNPSVVGLQPQPFQPTRF